MSKSNVNVNVNVKNIFTTTSEDCMIVFHQDQWTDGDLTYGKDHRGPKMFGDTFLKGNFISSSQLKSDIAKQRYKEIIGLNR